MYVVRVDRPWMPARSFCVDTSVSSFLIHNFKFLSVVELNSPLFYFDPVPITLTYFRVYFSTGFPVHTIFHSSRSSHGSFLQGKPIFFLSVKENFRIPIAQPSRRVLQKPIKCRNKLNVMQQNLSSTVICTICIHDT